MIQEIIKELVSLTLFKNESERTNRNNYHDIKMEENKVFLWNR